MDDLSLQVGLKKYVRNYDTDEFVFWYRNFLLCFRKGPFEKSLRNFALYERTTKKNGRKNAAKCLSPFFRKFLSDFRKGSVEHFLSMICHFRTDKKNMAEITDPRGFATKYVIINDTLIHDIF